MCKILFLQALYCYFLVVSDSLRNRELTVIYVIIYNGIMKCIFRSIILFAKRVLVPFFWCKGYGHGLYFDG